MFSEWQDTSIFNSQFTKQLDDCISIPNILTDKYDNSILSSNDYLPQAEL